MDGKADKGYQLALKDPLMKGSTPAYAALAIRIMDHAIRIDVTLLSKGESAHSQIKPSLTFSHSALTSPGGGGGKTVLAGDYSRSEVFVAGGGDPNGVAGYDGPIAQSDVTLMAHGLYGETAPMPTPALRGNRWAAGAVAVDVENEIRKWMQLPQRSGRDHDGYTEEITVHGK